MGCLAVVYEDGGRSAQQGLLVLDSRGESEGAGDELDARDHKQWRERDAYLAIFPFSRMPLVQFPFGVADPTHSCRQTLLCATP